MTAEFLRQRFNQLRDLLRQNSRHQEFATRRRHLIEQGLRHSERHTIVVLSRCKVVCQRIAHIVHQQLRRKLLGGDAGRLVPHQVVFFQVQQLGLFALSFFAPVLERRAVVNIGRDALIVKREDQFIVHQHIGTARLVFQRFDVGNQFLVVRKERRLGVEFACHQRLANKYLARLCDIHRPVMHAFLGVDDQPVQSATFPSRHLCRLLLPVRVEIAAFDQMCANLFQPLRFDARHTAREQFCGLDDLGGNHPLGAFLRQHRIRRDEEFDLARTEVIRLLVHTFAADVAEQPGQQRLVDLLISRRLLVKAHAHLRHLCVQLLVQLVPLAQTQRRQEFFTALVRPQFVGLLVLDRILKPRPQFYVGKKIRALVIEALVRRIRRFAPFRGSITRVLQGERAGDDEDLVQALELPSRQQQTRHLGIERQFGQLMTQWRELAHVVNGVEFLQQLVTVRDGARTRRLDERKFLHLAQPQRTHAQDDSGQRHAENFGIGKLRPLQKIRFLVQTDAHAAHHATATTGTLIGCGACDVLDAQLLHLLPHTVAVDARQPAVNYVADVGYGKRSLRHIGCRHHAPHTGSRFEYAVLLGDGQAREQRQDFQALVLVLAQRFGGIAYLAFAGQEYQHVAFEAPDGEFIQCAAYCLWHVLHIAIFVLLRRTVAYFNWIGAACDLNDGGSR